MNDFLDKRRAVVFSCYEAPTADSGAYTVVSILLVIAAFVVIGSIIESCFLSPHIRSLFLNNQQIAEPPSAYLSDSDGEDVIIIDPSEKKIIFEKEFSNTLSSRKHVQENLMDDKNEFQPNGGHDDKETIIEAITLQKPAQLLRIFNSGAFKASKSTLFFCLFIQFWRCWSVVYNFRKLYYPSSSNLPSNSRFAFMHGIRVFSTIWMTMGLFFFQFLYLLPRQRNNFAFPLPPRLSLFL